MVFVFGIDIPLVEMIFVLTLALLLLLGLLIYVVIVLRKLTKTLETILRKENLELRGLKDITEEEKEEAHLLRVIRTELDKIVYSQAYKTKLEEVMKTKGRKPEEQARIKRIATAFWNEVAKLNDVQRCKNVVQREEKIKTEQERLKTEQKKVEADKQKLKKVIKQIKKK